MRERCSERSYVPVICKAKGLTSAPPALKGAPMARKSKASAAAPAGSVALTVEQATLAHGCACDPIPVSSRPTR